MENVPGLLTANSGRAFDEVLSDLADLGYDTEWERISAEAVGAPHLRRRIFIIAYADSDAIRVQQIPGRECEAQAIIGDDGQEESMAYATSDGLEGRQRPETARQICTTIGGGGSRTGTLADTAITERGASESQSLASTRWRTTESRERFSSGPTRDDWWLVEPDVGRVADGVPSRVDRLRGLGNAVVPQCGEFVGRQIMSFEYSCYQTKEIL
jgi:DNA (cytosine-5)-methyltransferase 1